MPLRHGLEQGLHPPGASLGPPESLVRCFWPEALQGCRFIPTPRRGGDAAKIPSSASPAGSPLPHRASFPGNLGEQSVPLLLLGPLPGRWPVELHAGQGTHVLISTQLLKVKLPLKLVFNRTLKNRAPALPCREPKSTAQCHVPALGSLGLGPLSHRRAGPQQSRVCEDPRKVSGKKPQPLVWPNVPILVREESLVTRWTL